MANEFSSVVRSVPIQARGGREGGKENNNNRIPMCAVQTRFELLILMFEL
jgi:hypothetical protein